MNDVIIGYEVVKLGEIDDNSPWRMTVDYWDEETGKIVRSQVTGKHWNGWPEGPPERTLEDLARVQMGTTLERVKIARALDALDREFAAKVAPLVTALQRAQIVVLYGQEGLDLLDREKA